MIGAKITRNGDIYVPRFEEGFSSLLDEGVVGEFHTTLDLLNVNSKERIAPLSGHVATLIPGGGVAVTVGTTNLVSDPENWIPNTNEHQDTISTGEKFLGCAVAKTIKKTDSTPPSTLIYLSSIAPGETYTASIYVKHLPDIRENARLIFYKESMLASARAKGTGDWERLEVTYTNNTGSTLEGVSVYYYPARNQGSITFTAAPQVEKLGFATPVTKGTRPRGILSYPVINSGTEMAVIIKTSKPELLQPTGSHHLLALFSDVSAPYPDTFVLFAENGVNELRFRTRDSEGLSQNDVIITNCWDDKEHMVVAYMNHSPASGRHKKELYFDGELVGYSDPSGMPDLSKAVDTRLGHWDGTAFWGSPISLFSIIDTCTPEFIYNISKSKARLSPKGFFIPGGMEEKHTISFDKAGYFASFSNDLLIRNKIHPTDSIKPNGLDGATKTDYGLIYNTNGNLCATLLPEGGVAVTEGTTNLFPLEKSVVVRGGTAAYGYSVTSGLVQGGTYTLRAFIKVEPNDDTVNSRMTLRFIYSDGTSNTHATGSFPKDGVEYEYILTKTADPDKTLVEIDGWILDHSSVGPGGKYQSARNIQLEQKSFATPFTKDTRPPGRLPYDVPQLKGARDFTLHFKFLPYMFKEAAWGQYLFSTRTDNYLHYYASINDSGTRFSINTALEEDDTYVYAHIYNPPININSWHRFVMTGRQEGNQATLSIYLDGVEVYTSTRVGTLRPFPGILALGTNHSLGSVFNGAFRELYICPYAVSPETVEAWHNNPVKIGATLKTKGELKEFCPYVLNKGYFAPLNHGLAFIDLATENKFIKPLGME